MNNSDDSEDDEDDGEVEDENGDLNDPKEWEDDFLRVLPLLRSKSSAIFDKNLKFFEPEAQEAHLNEQERLKKAFTDAAARTTGGDGDADGDDLVQLKPKTAEELRAEEEHYGEWLKKHQEMQQKVDATLVASASARGDKPASSSGSKKSKSSAAAAGGPDIGGSAGDEILLRFWKEDANLTEEEKYLRKYIWEKMWIDNGENDDDDDDDDDEMKGKGKDDEDEDVEKSGARNISLGDGEDEFEDEQDRFEHRYNFRYEEPEGAEITQYPRVIEGSQRVNKKAEKRAAKRKERKERKQLEKLEKVQEIARMKALQKELINEKLDMVKKTAGLARTKEEDELIKSLNFDDDFDPKKWDEKLASIFNDEYYAEEEDTKPVFEHDDFIDNNDQLDKSSAAALLNPLHADTADVNGVDYDADEVPDDDDDDEDIDGDAVMADDNNDDNNDDDDDEKMKDDEENESNPVLEKALEADTILVGKHLKKKQKKQQLLKQQGEEEGDGEGKKEEEKTVTPEEAQKAAREAKAMIEKYYNLDFEDIIGDIPCRFKYTAVEPDHSGLTVEDVLCADDDALAQVVPIKKIATYLPKNEQITSRPIRGLFRRIYGKPSQQKGGMRKKGFGKNKKGDSKKKFTKTQKDKKFKKGDKKKAGKKVEKKTEKKEVEEKKEN